MKPALTDLIDRFQRENPGLRIETAYGASGSLYAQMLHGSPFDVFLSADSEYARRLADAGLASDGRVHEYATGRLVLWAPGAIGEQIASRGPDVLREEVIRRVAIANPAHAPYGRAARETISARGLEAALRTKLVHGESVEQAAQFAHGGAADAAFISLTLARSLRGAGGYWIVPEAEHAPLEHGLIILAQTREPALAQRFVGSLKDPGGRRILDIHGLKPPEQ